MERSETYPKFGPPDTKHTWALLLSVVLKKTALLGLFIVFIVILHTFFVLEIGLTHSLSPDRVSGVMKMCELCQSLCLAGGRMVERLVEVSVEMSADCHLLDDFTIRSEEDRLTQRQDLRSI